MAAKKTKGEKGHVPFQFILKGRDKLNRIIAAREGTPEGIAGKKEYEKMKRKK